MEACDALGFKGEEGDREGDLNDREANDPRVGRVATPLVNGEAGSDDPNAADEAERLQRQREDIDELKEKPCVAIINLGSKQIGPFMSECLVLGSISKNGDVLLLQPSDKAELGDKVS